jgi:uncharacterized membrane protein YhaH (DUF805 family)
MEEMQPESPYQPPASFEPAPPPLSGGSSPALTLKQIWFSFTGRIPRRTYWLWSVVSAVAFLIPLALLMPLVQRHGAGEVIAIIVLIPLVLLFIWISLAIRVKRWHDVGKPGVWVLIGLIPYAGGIISLIFLGCMRGTVGWNRFGEDPT